MIKLNCKIAELCGIILGDGHMHTTQNRVTITGSLEDAYYYQSYVIPLFESLFGFTPSMRFVKEKHVCYIYACNQRMFKFLINKLRLRRGNKINACVPKIIIKNVDLIPHFLRGFFDTDGSLKFSKQTKLINYYPRIRLYCQDSLLSRDISSLLYKLKFNFSKWRDFRKITGWKNSRGIPILRNRPILYYEISGKDNLIKWMRLIGSSNPVHLTKFLLWKKNFYVTPRCSLKHRLKVLNLEVKNLYKKTF